MLHGIQDLDVPRITSYNVCYTKLLRTFRMLMLDRERVLERVSTCCINLSGQSLSDERFHDFLIDEVKNSGVRNNFV